MDPQARRVFLALVCAPPVAAELHRVVRERLGGEQAERDFRLPRTEGLHLTLVFLGDVQPGVLERLQAALAPACAGLLGPRFVLDRAGAFPRPGRERVLWIGVREEQGAAGRLALLHAAARAASERAGCVLEPDDSFHAHVTVARPRAARPRVPPAFYAPLAELEWRCGAVTLLESVRGSGPAFYRALAEVRLEDA